MSAMLNSTVGIRPLGQGATKADNKSVSDLYQGGLNISPENVTAARADFVTSLTFLFFGLGFFAAATLFVMALITLALG